MKSVTLHFSSFDELWRFRQYSKCNYFEMNERKLMITCECSDEDLKLAVEEFGAIVVTEMQKKNESVH